jgi:hypothetical protein
MVNDLPPEPMVSADVDLRDFAFMPLDVVRLRDSGLAAKATGDEFRAAVLLWCASWHQIPAGTLPNDDAELANLCGYGRVVKEWRKVRAGALHGWVLASDGRLHHPVIVEKALDAWEKKLMQRWRSECARIRKHNERHHTKIESPDFGTWKSQGCRTGQPLGVTCDISNESHGQPCETHSKGQGQGQGQGQGDSLTSRSQSTKGRGQPPESDRSPAGSRLAPDWTPTDALKAWAAEARPDLDIDLQASRFRDYWAAMPGAKGRKTDWAATWRNWIRSEKLPPPGSRKPDFDWQAIARAAGYTEEEIAADASDRQ